MARYTDEDLLKVVAAASSLSDVMYRLGFARGCMKTRVKVREHYESLGADTSHFGTRNCIPVAAPIEQILVEGSKYTTTHIKERLYKEGLKTRV